MEHLRPSDSLTVKGNLRVTHVRKGQVLSDETMNQTVTTVGKNWLVDKMQDILAATELLKWHKSGTGVTVAAAGNTDLSTGIYTRTAGTRTEGASSNIYRSVGTISYTGTRSITEWGIFSTSTSGTMFARKTFAAKSVVSGDAIQFTWDLTVS